MITQEVNTLALAQAAEFVVGQEKSTEIGGIYLLIDQAMKAGYELGKAEAREAVEKEIDAAFDEGWDQGYDQGETDGLDEGYLNGVREARAFPSSADRVVANILAAREASEDQGDLFDEGAEWGLGWLEPVEGDEEYDQDAQQYAFEFMEAAPGCECEECEALRADQETVAAR